MNYPRVGDIYFQDLGCGAVCDAINGVTPGWRGSEINHCGLVVERGGALHIAEAIYPTVRLTPIDTYARRSVDERGRPRVLAARLVEDLGHLVHRAAEYAIGQIGVPYDPLFRKGVSALYCSELIVDAFAAANEGVSVFPERPMTFRDERTGEILDFWRRYYERLGSEVPEGEIGSNPGELSLSAHLRDHTQFGSLRGLPL